VADVRAAAAVVADPHVQDALAGNDLDLGGRGAGVLGGVGQRLGDGVVGGDLDRLGQPPGRLDVKADGNCGAAGQRPQRRAQPALGQDRRVEAAGDLAQLPERTGRLGDRAL
jgi:hypothetical protein